MDFFAFLSDITSYLFIAIPFALAIGLAIFLPVMVVYLSGLTSKWPDYYKLTLILALIVIGSTLSVAFSGRIIVSSDADFLTQPNNISTMSTGGGNYWFSRIAHLIILSVASVEIFIWCIRRRYMGRGQFAVWAAAMTYYFLSVPVSALLGHFRDFNINLIYSPIVFTAVALLISSSELQKTLRYVRWILLIPLLGSLVAIYFSPQLVIETGYKSLIPGLSIRLAGLTEHANSLGLIAAISLFLELSKFVRNKPNILFLLIIIATLVLAQSKTAWIMTVFGIALLSLHNDRDTSSESRRLGVGLVRVVGIFVLASIVLSMVVWKMDALQSYLATDRTGLMTFTGRTKIWEITWGEFLINPISGYGLAIWDPLYRFQHGMMYVGQAHNQFLQTLGQAGLLGIISLTFYVGVLLRRGYLGRNQTYGFSLLIVMILLVRGFSESPMRMVGIMDFDSFTHILAFATASALVGHAGAKQSVPLVAV